MVVKRMTKRLENGEIEINCEGCKCCELPFCTSDDCMRELLYRLGYLEDLVTDCETNDYDLELLPFRIE